jgi:hypothetical protein
MRQQQQIEKARREGYARGGGRVKRAQQNAAQVRAEQLQAELQAQLQQAQVQLAL